MKKNKFISHLAEDINQQNHRLKDELIKERKQLKRYQEMMIKELEKIADQLAIGTDKYIFEDPEQVLVYFVKLVRDCGKSTEDYRKTVQKNNLKIIYLEQDLRQINQTLRQLQQSYQKLCVSHTKLQQECDKLEEKLITQEMANNQAIKSNQEKISKLIMEVDSMQVNFGIKLKEQKKAINEKNNKQLAALRQKFDHDLFMSEKSFRGEVDRKEREIRGLMQMINNCFTPQQDQAIKRFSPAINRLAARSSTISEEELQVTGSSALEVYTNQQQIQTLMEIIKPFADHTSLNEKISQLRKQLMSVNHQFRQVSTKLSNLQAVHREKVDQLQIMEQKYLIISKELYEVKQRNIQVEEMYRKCDQDKKVMENYYDQKWNQDFNNVKFHLEKKYHDMTNGVKLEQQENKFKLEERMKELAEYEQKIELQNVALREQIQGLLLKIMQHEIQKQSIKKSMQSLKENLRMGEAMSREQIHTYKATFFAKQQSLLKQISDKSDEISRLQSKLKKTIAYFEGQIKRIQREAEEKETRNISELKFKHMHEIAKKDSEIEKLVVEVQSHKEAIENVHRHTSQRVESETLKVEKIKEKEISEIKIGHFEEVKRLKEKMMTMDNRIDDLKQEINAQKEKHKKEVANLNKTVEQKDTQIEDHTKTIEKMQQIKKSTFEKYITLRNEREDIELQKQSLRVMLESHSLQIDNLKAEIERLVAEKDTWSSELNLCRKEMEEGLKEIKAVNEKRILHYQSKVWQLESIVNSGGISKKGYERIRSLTEQKNRLQEQMQMKQAEILVLKEVNGYYETKIREADSKMTVNYELKDQKQPIFVRRPKNRNINVRPLRSQVSEDLDGFTGREAYDIKQLNTMKNIGVREKDEPQNYFLNSRRPHSKNKHRVNSSMM